AVTKAKQDFKGNFRELFANNASVAAADATELATRLDEVAKAARRLKEEAGKEQKRRTTAREWKKRRDDRNVFQEFGDWLTGGAEDPPVGPPAEEPTIQVAESSNGSRETPPPGGGGGGGGAGTSSARPSNLRHFATVSREKNGELRGRPAKLRQHLSNFAAQCRWGRLSA